MIRIPVDFSKRDDADRIEIVTFVQLQGKERVLLYDDSMTVEATYMGTFAGGKRRAKIDWLSVEFKGLNVRKN